MARLRKGSLSSPADREILGHVAAAERALRKALDACVLAKRQSRSPGSNLRMARVIRTQRDLHRVMAALSNVHRIVPLHDMGEQDPGELDRDLMSPEERAAFDAVEDQREDLLAAVAEKLTAAWESAE